MYINTVTIYTIIKHYYYKTHDHSQPSLHHLVYAKVSYYETVSYYCMRP
jgi:hypothetical protein